MINLSEGARQSPDFHWWEKLDSFFGQTDIYLAENVRDYRENAPHIPWPWNKRLSYPCPMACIILRNVGLTVPERMRCLPTYEWVTVHDETGNDLMRWTNEKHAIFPADYSFEDAQEEQGLTTDDWVYEVFCRYLIGKGLANIVSVEKNRPGRRISLNKSLLEKIREIPIQPEPLPQHA